MIRNIFFEHLRYHYLKHLCTLCAYDSFTSKIIVNVYRKLKKKTPSKTKLIPLKKTKIFSLYTIVAPQELRPHSNYNVSIILHDNAPPTVVKVSIIDVASDIDSKEIKVTPSHPEMVSLQIGNLNLTRTYKIVAEGLSGIEFKNSSMLRIDNRNHTMFIYTDKAIYKPGETIKFRILVLDLNLRPAELKDASHLNVHITVSRE